MLGKPEHEAELALTGFSQIVDSGCHVLMEPIFSKLPRFGKQQLLLQDTPRVGVLQWAFL